MKIIKKPGKSKMSLLAWQSQKNIIEIGKNIYKNWKIYCDRFDLGLFLTIFLINLKKKKNKLAEIIGWKK